MSSPDGAPPTGAPAFPPPVDRDDLGRGPMIMAITWIFRIAALSAITARLVVRGRKRGVFWGWDDYLMLVAVILQLPLQCLATSSYRSGMGKHDRSVYPEELMAIRKRHF
ncbi:hypothetical protein DL765_007462 [Monosporascus sp. GIB2]|nr:hypothetical protein DL765_007462 [Monosporascus sp. GIB2]